MTFTDDFTYPDGPLAGNGLWVLNGYAQSLEVVTDHLEGDVGVQDGCEADLSGLGITFTGPFTESVIVNYNATLNDGGGIVTMANFNTGVALTFSAGDGALNQVGSVHLFDAIQDQTIGPVAFPADTDVTVEIEFDGSDLILRFNGVEVTRNVGAGTGGQGGTIDLVLDGLTAPPSITLDHFTATV